MWDFAADIAKMADCEAILEFVYENCLDNGATWFSYHFTPIFESQTSKKTFIWSRDYPLEFQRRYVSGAWREIDPVPRLTFQYGPVLVWRDAIELGRGDPKAERFFEETVTAGVDNWVGFAVFGPRNRNAYCSMRFERDPAGFSNEQLQQIHSLLLAAHLQICKIMGGGRASVSLSEREREVLEWMGRGKSSVDIGTILDISPETVRTYTRRIFDKLDTNDRVTATVRALKLGLVEL
ncbi:hypothetical protein A3718_03630 [Erythrobacter sp. HI0019]|uniref:helix-turn-helix transcriptional regulator n=1 Tax=unclassified Erythrobacter TaxID=2633097 RepID=UPI0007B883DB|nr:MULTISPECIES: LuxR family transcriptional regulator [unclassified Erythrobacter]KZX88827.1 hypothetical protein A3718_03630 [Erythrobacter sp. HI0019]KZY01827.1 hypothetical protein A3723_05135 [Erythrobacter sp. HI0028]